MTTFAKRLRRTRQALQLTQAELAERALAHQKSVQRWERGGDIPTALTVIRLADALGVSARYLLCMVDMPGKWVNPAQDERKLIEIYRGLPEGARRVLLDSARDLLQAQHSHRSKAS